MFSPASGGAPLVRTANCTGAGRAHPTRSIAAGTRSRDVERRPVDVGSDRLRARPDVLDRLRDDLHVRVAGERVVLEELVLRERPQVALREGLVRLVVVAMHLKSL